MGRGYFSQGACVLLKQVCSVDDLVRALPKFKVVKQLEQPRAKGQWINGNPGVVVAYRPDLNGFLNISIVDEPWPDHMGDPKKEPTLFGAWSMGYLTPLAFPGNLERAIQHSWQWNDVKSTVGRHRAFIRILCSYVFGADEDAKVLPDDWDPLDEVEFITKVADALLDLPAAICYFNPAGEKLIQREDLRETRAHNLSQDLPDLDVWTNVRVFNLPDGCSFMDSVGMEQFDLPDVEVTFNPKQFDAAEIHQFLLNVAVYMVRQRPTFETGHTINGPGGNWIVEVADDATATPPRRTLRWSSLD